MLSFKFTLFLLMRRNNINLDLRTRPRNPILFLDILKNSSLSLYSSNNSTESLPLYSSHKNSNSTYLSASPHQLTRKRKVKRIELPTFTKKEGDLVKRTGSIVDVPAIKALLGGLEVPKDLKSLFVNDPHKMSENLNPNISDHTRRLIDIINHKRRLIAGIVEIREKME